MSDYVRYDPSRSERIQTLLVDGVPDEDRGRHYRASSLLTHAVNTALAIGRPLLVSGEPGCGKTSLGFSIARNLGIERVHFFSVTSNAEARSLFYDYDAIRHLHGTQLSRPEQGASLDSGGHAPTDRRVDPRNYLRYRALGRAILDASEPSAVRDLLPLGEEPHAEPVRSVVVIDEIDKASRDFPNDLLNEVDQLWFRVPELVGWADVVETPRITEPARRPIIVITSNLERQLPDAFLRRCVFHHIGYPEDDLELIVLGHLARARVRLASDDVRASIALVAWARTQPFDKPPGLAELLEFAKALGRRHEEMSGASFQRRAQACVAAIGKSRADVERLLEYLGATRAD